MGFAYAWGQWGHAQVGAQQLAWGVGPKSQAVLIRSREPSNEHSISSSAIQGYELPTDGLKVHSIAAVLEDEASLWVSTACAARVYIFCILVEDDALRIRMRYVMHPPVPPAQVVVGSIHRLHAVIWGEHMVLLVQQSVQMQVDHHHAQGAVVLHMAWLPLDGLSPSMASPDWFAVASLSTTGMQAYGKPTPALCIPETALHQHQGDVWLTARVAVTLQPSHLHAGLIVRVWQAASSVLLCAALQVWPQVLEAEDGEQETGNALGMQVQVRCWPWQPVGHAVCDITHVHSTVCTSCHSTLIHMLAGQIVCSAAIPAARISAVGLQWARPQPTALASHPLGVLDEHAVLHAAVCAQSSTWVAHDTAHRLTCTANIAGCPHCHEASGSAGSSVQRQPPHVHCTATLPSHWAAGTALPLLGYGADVYLVGVNTQGQAELCDWHPEAIRGAAPAASLVELDVPGASHEPSGQPADKVLQAWGLPVQSLRQVALGVQSDAEVLKTQALVTESARSVSQPIPCTISMSLATTSAARLGAGLLGPGRHQPGAAVTMIRLAAVPQLAALTARSTHRATAVLTAAAAMLYSADANGYHSRARASQQQQQAAPNTSAARVWPQHAHTPLQDAAALHGAAACFLAAKFELTGWRSGWQIPDPAPLYAHAMVLPGQLNRIASLTVAPRVRSHTETVQVKLRRSLAKAARVQDDRQAIISPGMSFVSAVRWSDVHGGTAALQQLLLYVLHGAGVWSAVVRGVQHGAVQAQELHMPSVVAALYHAVQRVGTLEPARTGHILAIASDYLLQPSAAAAAAAAGMALHTPAASSATRQQLAPHERAVPMQVLLEALQRRSMDVLRTAEHSAVFAPCVAQAQRELPAAQRRKSPSPTAAARAASSQSAASASEMVLLHALAPPEHNTVSWPTTARSSRVALHHAVARAERNIHGAGDTSLLRLAGLLRVLRAVSIGDLVRYLSPDGTAPPAAWAAAMLQQMSLRSELTIWQLPGSRCGCSSALAANADIAAMVQHLTSLGDAPMCSAVADAMLCLPATDKLQRDQPDLVQIAGHARALISLLSWQELDAAHWALHSAAGNVSTQARPGKLATSARLPLPAEVLFHAADPARGLPPAHFDWDKVWAEAGSSLVAAAVPTPWFTVQWHGLSDAAAQAATAQQKAAHALPGLFDADAEELDDVPLSGAATGLAAAGMRTPACPQLAIAGTREVSRGTADMLHDITRVHSATYAEAGAGRDSQRRFQQLLYYAVLRELEAARQARHTQHEFFQELGIRPEDSTTSSSATAGQPSPEPEPAGDGPMAAAGGSPIGRGPDMSTAVHVVIPGAITAADIADIMEEWDI